MGRFRAYLTTYLHLLEFATASERRDNCEAERRLVLERDSR